MFFGISALLKKKFPSPGILHLIKPLTAAAWCLLAVIAAAFSVGLYFIEKFTPKQSDGIKRLTALDAIWFVFSWMIIVGTSQTSTKSMGSRILSACLWIFTLSLFSAYVASLVTAMMADRPLPLPTSMAELAASDSYKVGYAQGSALSYILHKSETAHMKTLGRRLIRFRNKQSALDKLATDNFAYIAESPYIQHLTRLDCSLVEIRSNFYDKSYVIPMVKGAQFKGDVDKVIKRLWQEGKLQEFYERWWSPLICGGKSETNHWQLGAREIASGLGLLSAGMVLAASTTFARFYLEKNKRNTKKSIKRVRYVYE